MERKNLAVLGAKDEVLLYKVVGADVFSPSMQNLKQTFARLATTHKIVLVGAQFAEVLKQQIDECSNQVYPLVQIIPSMQKQGFLCNWIENKAKKILGINLTFEGEKNE